MPHCGQRPGSSLTTSGCIGHAKTAPSGTSNVHLRDEGEGLVRGCAEQRAIRSRSAAMSALVRSYGKLLRERGLG